MYHVSHVMVRRSQWRPDEAPLMVIWILMLEEARLVGRSVGWIIPAGQLALHRWNLIWSRTTLVKALAWVIRPETRWWRSRGRARFVRVQRLGLIIRFILIGCTIELIWTVVYLTDIARCGFNFLFTLNILTFPTAPAHVVILLASGFDCGRILFEAIRRRSLVACTTIVNFTEIVISIEHLIWIHSQAEMGWLIHSAYFHWKSYRDGYKRSSSHVRSQFLVWSSVDWIIFLSYKTLIKYTQKFIHKLTL
jgi:hypothetical protein